MNQPRVLILSNSFLPVIGGAQYELKWFLDYLDQMEPSQRQVQVHFAYPNEASREFARFNNIPTHDLKLCDFRKPSIARMIIRLGKLLRAIRPDIVHCHNVLPTGLWTVIASRMFNVRTRIIATSHGDDVVQLPEWSYGRRDSMRTRILTRLVTGRLSLHLLPSKAMTPFAIRAGTILRRISVIPNGIPVGDDFDFEIGDGNTAGTSPPRSPVIPHGSALNILCLSSGRRIKNLDALIEAFAIARDQLHYSRLLLTCVDERIVNLVKKMGLSHDVEFIGELTGSRKQALFKRSDVLCVVSHFESFSLAALEGLKHGCAIVASKVGGIPEFIEHEYNGLLVSSNEPAQIAAALIRLMREYGLRRHLVDNGFRTVHRYSISHIVKEHINAYQYLSSQGCR